MTLYMIFSASCHINLLITQRAACHPCQNPCIDPRGPTGRRLLQTAEKIFCRMFEMHISVRRVSIISDIRTLIRAILCTATTGPELDAPVLDMQPRQLYSEEILNPNISTHIYVMTCTRVFSGFSWQFVIYTPILTRGPMATWHWYS